MYWFSWFSWFFVLCVAICRAARLLPSTSQGKNKMQDGTRGEVVTFSSVLIVPAKEA